MGGDVLSQKRKPLKPGQAGQGDDLAARFEQIKPQLFEELSALVRGKMNPEQLMGAVAPSTQAAGSLPKALPSVISPLGAAGLGLGEAVAPRLATSGTSALAGALTKAGTTAIPAMTSAIPNLTSAVSAPATSGIAGTVGGALGRAVPVIGPLVGAGAQLATHAAEGKPITGEDVGSIAGGAVGGAGGAAGGAAIGASAGAAIGAAFFGVGAAVGAPIGAAIGGAVGGAAGGTAGGYAGGAIGRAAGGGRARIAAAGGPSPFGKNYTPNAQPFEQGV